MLYKANFKNSFYRQHYEDIPISSVTNQETLQDLSNSHIENRESQYHHVNYSRSNNQENKNSEYTDIDALNDKILSGANLNKKMNEKR